MDNIYITSPSGNILYSDSLDHFENGLLRLLNFDRNMFDKWLSYSDEYDGPILDKLKYGFSKMKPSFVVTNDQLIIGPGPNNESGNIWYQLDNTYFIIKNKNNSIAWLARRTEDQLIHETNPPIYEENYFNGNPINDGGYGDYIKQASWRIEKANRQLNQIKEITNIHTGHALDIGSGYGYFRNALERHNFSHDGIEISKHACMISKKYYGYESFNGTIDMYIKQSSIKYDLITLWDVIEHISNPIKFLQDIFYCLNPGGFVVIKTPNINCPEVEIFKSFYHSFKREHLFYFSDQSLKLMAQKVGLSLIHTTSISHLLKGFLNQKEIEKLSNECNGSDIIVYLKK